MEYFKKLLNKSTDIQLLEEKIILKRRSILNLKELKQRLIQIGNIEKENTEIINKMIK